MFQPELETLPLPKLRVLQAERLRNLIGYLDQHSDFYHRKFKEKNITPGTIKSMADIRYLPVTYKSDLRDHYPFGLFTVPKDQLARIHCSSGTTGKPTVVGYTARDLDIFAEVVARSLAAAGATKGMLLHNAYGYGLFTGGLGLHAGAERLGMSVLPISGGMTDRQINLILDFQPEVICCTPSYALTIADAFAKKGIDPKDISLRYAVLGAEPWTDTVRSSVEASLGVTATNIYGLSEIIGPGVSNEDYREKNGSYIWEDHFFPEILDPVTHEPLPEGQQGVLVFTTLTKEAMPLVRYWTNDITHLFYDQDGSRTMVKMGPIVGRTDDMLIVRGVNVYPTQIEAAIKDIPGILPHYFLYPRVNNQIVTQLDIHIEVSREHAIKYGFDLTDLSSCPNAKKLGSLLQDKIKKEVGISVGISICLEDSLPKCEGGKMSRVIIK